MMHLAFSLDDIPGDAIGLFIVMLISFLGWLKNKVFNKQPPEEVDEDDPMREVIWRRQMGLPDEDDVENDPTVYREPTPVAPPPLQRVVIEQPTPQPVAPPALPVVPEVDERDEALALAFEQNLRRKRRRGASSNALVRNLRNPATARQAIIVSEILSPPAALREQPQHLS